MTNDTPATPPPKVLDHVRDRLRVKHCSKRLIGQQRDHEGLLLVHKFGWMRATELGRMLWPASARPAVNASELVGKWKRAGWVLVRPLPDHMGQALVLSAAGAAYLRTCGHMDAVTGKDWGETRTGDWVAPTTWRHELLALGLLAHLHSDGWQVIPERQLRRENRPGKFPDGLAIRGDDVTWIEVENARKSGPNRNQMVEALILASQGEGERLSGQVANRALLAYAVGARDERGYRLDHRHHVIAALARRAPVDVPLLLAELTVTGTAGVGKVAISETNVAAEAVTRRLASIVWLSQAAVPGFDAYEFFRANGLEYRHGDGQFSRWWSIRDGEREVAAADVESAEEAQRALVSQLRYREWCR